MKVIIPVAGIGRRLKPHTDSLPKPLLEVGGKPILDHVVRPLEGLEVEEVIFVVGHLGDQVRRYVQQNYSFKARFVEQDQLLGLGYAVNVAVRDIDGGDVLILLGDTVVDCDLQAFVAAGDYVLGVHQVPDPQRFGIVELADGYVSSLEEKPDNPKTNLALIGLYYFKEAAGLKMELIRLVESGRVTSGEIQLTDALAAMVDGGARCVAHDVHHWYDCGTKETLLATNRFLLEKAAGSSPVSGCRLKPPVHIDPSAVIEDSTIGPFVSVGAGAGVRGSTIENCIISSGADVSNSTLKDSLVGPKAIVAGRTGSLNIGEHSEVDGG